MGVGSLAGAAYDALSSTAKVQSRPSNKPPDNTGGSRRGSQIETGVIVMLQLLDATDAARATVSRLNTTGDRAHVFLFFSFPFGLGFSDPGSLHENPIAQQITKSKLSHTSRFM